MPNKRVAQPQEDLIRLYLNDVGKHGLLTKDDEVRLAQAVEAGRTVLPRTDGATVHHARPPVGAGPTARQLRS